VHGGGESVVGGLGHIHMVIGMDKSLRIGQGADVGDDLVDVHIGLGAAAGLPNFQRKLLRPASRQHLVAGVANQRSALVIQLTAGLVGLSGRLFQHRKSGNQLRRHRLCTDGEIGQALVNRKPSKVNNVAFSSGFDNAKITWTDAFDDYNFIKEYQVKVNDEVVYTTEDVFEYTLQNIKSGTQYKIEIVAIDHQELMSDYDTVMFTLPKHGYVNLGNYEKDRSGMELYSSFTNTSDTYIIEEFIDGVKCYRTASKKNDGEEYGVGKDYTYMYFRVDSDVVSSDNRKVMVEVTYYDTGKTSESVNIQYNAEDGSPSKIAKVAQITNSKTWKTATIVLEDAKFEKLVSLSKSDFRLVNSTGNSPIYISNVRVMAID